MTDIDDLISRYADLTAAKAELDDQLAAIRTQLAEYGAGTHAGQTGKVTITYPRRFQAKLAAQALADTPELIEACSSTTISASKAKAALPPALYQRCCTVAEKPTVRVSAS